MSTRKLSILFKYNRKIIQRLLRNSNNNDVLNKLDKYIKNVDINELCIDYLNKNISMKYLMEKYDCASSTIYKKLRQSNNKDVLEKLKRKKSNIIYVENNLIYVLYKNNKHIFDFSEKLLEKLKRFYWTEGTNGHLHTSYYDNNGKQKIFKSYWLVINKPSKGFVVDHINKNEKDNRKENLRYATKQTNNINRNKNKNNKSGYKGVYFAKNIGLYIAKIQKGKEIIYLGCYNNPKDAYIARARKELEIYGEYARIQDGFEWIIEEWKNIKEGENN
jgi:hypothetical protein